MRVLKHLFDFYINSSVHVALAVFSLSWVTLIQFGIPYDENILYFIFYATISGYNFVKYFGLAKFHHRSLANWLKTIQIFSFISFVLMCYYAYRLEKTTLLYIFGFSIITFLYAMPLLPKKVLLDSQQNLRSVSGIKIYVIALVWTGVTLLLPLLNNNFPIDFDVALTAIQRFLFVIVITLPFEIRDLQYDSIKLSTIPQRIGIKYTKLMGLLLLIAFFFIEYFKDTIEAKQLITLLVITFVTMVFLMFSKKGQGKYYSSFWVEGLPILWLVLILLLA